ncbi:MAG: class I SAM-dependent methyltransferase, partial [Clostridia bacterium]|nr:class I SAM-dependent methyltransferase [Clostridia bacterium]
MSSYRDFSLCYSRIMSDVDYDEIGDFIDAAIKKHYVMKTGIVCDLACGTGRLSGILSKKGYDMIGVDNSSEMLDIARNDNPGEKILYLNQDMTELDMFGTVDVFLSTMDSINHL